MNTKIKKLLIGASLLTAFTFANAKSAESQVRCLATAIYHEANNQTLAGKQAVGHVIINRKNDKQFPKSICGVVSQPNQFSWYRKMKHRYNEETMKIAREMLYQRPKDNTNGALFFHNPSVKPAWTKRMKMTRKIGNHYFYKL